MVFGSSQGSRARLTSNHDVLGSSNEVLKPRKSDYKVGLASNGHNLLYISSDYAKLVFKLKPMMSNFQ